MPTYEYRCGACGNGFEKFQRMSDPPVAECPRCGAQAERRVSGGAGLLFRGSGFYVTDYRSDGYKKAAEGETGGGPGADAKPADAKPADAKPAVKPSDKPGGAKAAGPAASEPASSPKPDRSSE